MTIYNALELEQLAKALGGLPVLACRLDSPAGRAGIVYGDIVMTVNGMATPDWSAYIEARALRTDAMTVEVFRNGELVQLELAFDRPDTAPDVHQILAEVLAERIVPIANDDDVMRPLAKLAMIN